MSLRDTLKTEKAKERYDKNFNSVETTFSQKELELHDKEIRAKAIDEFAEKLMKYTHGRMNGVYVDIPLHIFNEIAEQLKAGGKNE